jgi:hypothetical protein
VAREVRAGEETAVPAAEAVVAARDVAPIASAKTLVSSGSFFQTRLSNRFK